jgi:hypothetical protein
MDSTCHGNLRSPGRYFDEFRDVHRASEPFLLMSGEYIDEELTSTDRSLKLHVRHRRTLPKMVFSKQATLVEF